MSEEYDKLKVLLSELLQLDQPDLDFGVYRVLQARRAELLRFLDVQLPKDVSKALAAYEATDRHGLERELAEKIEKARALGLDPEGVEQVKELRGRIAGIDKTKELEGVVYDHTFRFFRRYYAEGDFLSKRVYKEGTYSLPYQGEEVKLYWANSDQYYVKSTEYLRDYSFHLTSEDNDSRRVHFRLVTATEGEHGTVKESQDGERRFRLAEDEPVLLDGEDLIVRFIFSGEKSKQSALNELAEACILGQDAPELAGLVAALGSRPAGGLTTLRIHIDRYTARNTFDYFVHKDLERFLRRELDFYIKNEVLRLDDLEGEEAIQVEKAMAMVRAIRLVVHKIVRFLAELEDLQRKLWLKKKFVISSEWWFRVDHVPAHLHAAVIENAAQIEEWRNTFQVDVSTSDDITSHPSLMLDTRHFDSEFTEDLLAGMHDLDDLVDGILVHGDNFQALQLMRARFEGRIDCVYIDPPYNTGDSEILYKNNYLHSSWMTLMANRLSLVPPLLDDAAAMFIAIDDAEMVNLSSLIDSEFPWLKREMIVVNHHPQGGMGSILANTHEYMLVCVPKGVGLTGTPHDEVEKRTFRRSGTSKSNFRTGRQNSFYALLLDPETNAVVGAEPPPGAGQTYDTGPTEDGKLRVYPIGEGGVERVWRKTYKEGLKLIEKGKLISSDAFVIYQLIAPEERKKAVFSNWTDSLYNAGTHGANLLEDILGEKAFSFPKSIYTVREALNAAADDDALVLDFFAGSGTTAHAVITLNREDGGRRKFVLVEQGDYFDKALVQRLKRVAFSPSWRKGIPDSVMHAEAVAGTPRVVKILRLESYEDSLNNLRLSRAPEVQERLTELQGEPFETDYVLNYMLRLEATGSQSLLNLEALADPREYVLLVKRPGSDESALVKVDLTETFNWLLGLAVTQVSRTATFHAEAERAGNGSFFLKADPVADPAGKWWFKTVLGVDPDGLRTLVVWRNLPGAKSLEETEVDNLVLSSWFASARADGRIGAFDRIFVNGDNALDKQRPKGETWHTELIEEHLTTLMFTDEGP